MILVKLMYIKQKTALRELLPEIKELHKTLEIIKHSGTMPVGKEHLFARYKVRGLVRMEKRGGKAYISDKLYLTKKGKRLLGSFRV